MNKVTTAFLAIVLFIPALAFAQDSGQSDKKLQEEQNQAAMTSTTGEIGSARHNMVGMVSNAGQNFTSDNTTYIVNNPKSLKNYDGQSVKVTFQFNTDTNTIHIISASPGQ
jgi:hypothetical protein